MEARYECPRCQTFFTHEQGDDDAFVECPSCGALAMPAGDATGSDTLARVLSSTHDVSALQTEILQADELHAAAAASAAAAAARVSDVPSDDDDDDDDDDRGPEYSAEGPPAGGDGGIFAGLMGAEPSAAAAHDDDDDDDDDDGDRDDDQEDDQQDDTSDGAGGFGDRFGDGFGDDDEQDEGDDDEQDEGEDDDRAARSATGAAELDLGLDDELGDFSLPSTAPGNKALSPAPKRPSPDEVARSRSLLNEGPQTNISDMGDALDDVRSSLGDDALDALGAAFDTLAQAPDQARRGGLTADELAFLEDRRGDVDRPRPKVQKPPPRPPEKPGQKRARPPPRKAKPTKARPAGLTLSAEAREAAFLPLSSRPAAPPPRPASRSFDEDIDAPTVALPPGGSVEEATSPQAPVRRPPAAADDDATDMLPRKRVPRERPSVMGGLHKGMLAAAVLFGLIAGGVAGAASAPSPVKRQDPRARAEAALADGNRYYEAGRFDDALGKYRAATNIDRTFAIAHRAKGSALAKQQLFDEAADAYREYLALEPTAIDAADIKAALARRGVAPVNTAATSATSTSSTPTPPAPPPDGGGDAAP